MHIALLDLGTASLRFEIYEISRLSRPKRLLHDRLMPRLGAGLYETGCLSPSGKVETIRFFDGLNKKLSDYNVTKVAAVATSAFREATDGMSFITELERVSNLNVQIISGAEEAKLIAKGILANERNIPSKCALIDIGGGSTEVSICTNETIDYSISLPLGSVRCQQLNLYSSPPTDVAFSKTKEILRSTLSSYTDLLAHSPAAVDWIGSSGTVRTLQGLDCMPKDNQNRFSISSLHKFIEKIRHYSISEITKIDGIDPKRADIILAGCLILDAVTETLGGQYLRASRFSLRHGLLEQLIEDLC